MSTFDTRRAAALAAMIVAVLFATQAQAQKDPGGGGGDPNAGLNLAGKKIGDYKVSVRDGQTYKPLEAGKYINGAGLNQSFYYYQFWNQRLPDEFNFKFFGKQIVTVGIGGGGWMSLESGVNVYDNVLLPNMQAPNGIIAPYWENLTRDTSDNKYPGGIRWMIDGEGDKQILKVEWVNMLGYNCYSYQQPCELSKHYTFQVWIHAASADADSLIQYYYAPIANPNGYDTPYPAMWGGYNMSGTIGGLESPDNALGVQAGCGNQCLAKNFPQNTVIQFGQGPDVEGTLTGDPIGWAGAKISATGTIANSGARDAIGFGAKLYVSEDNVLDPDDRVIESYPADLDENPDVGSLLSLNADGRFTVNFRASLPRDLDREEYYLIMEVDPTSAAHPLGLVEEDVEENNWSVFGPFAIADPTPDLAVQDITPEVLSVAPGTLLHIDWTAVNGGNLSAEGIPYWILLSVEDVITPSDTVIDTGFLSIDELSSISVPNDVIIPPSTNPGVYRLGLVIDPENQLREIDDFNNSGMFSEPILIGDDKVSIMSATLAAAYIGSPYCERMVAAGGNGTYIWAAKNAGQLPPGLLLREEPGDARKNGKPFDTLLCGTPSTTGTFQFDVEVNSNGASATRKLSLVVSGEAPPLDIVTHELPAATFQVGYNASLYAVGGQPPYTWSMKAGSKQLPRGITLKDDGHLVGMPELDGRYPFRVIVADKNGKTAESELILSVTPPGRLTCISQPLPGARVNAAYAAQLFAAGGAKPYIWSSVESRRLAEGVTDAGETVPDMPPPGLVLAESGSVSGTPSSSGAFLWTARVTDQNGQEDVCILSVDFSSGALNVTTSALPLVCTDEPYSVQLEATGGDGFLDWSLDDASALPEGIELTPQGALTGSVSPEVLEGNSSTTFNLTVRVRDTRNARGVGAVALRVQTCKTGSQTKVGSTTEKTGCGSNAAGGAASFVGLAALSLLVIRRRR